jgi:hypothetical protein
MDQQFSFANTTIFMKTLKMTGRDIKADNGSEHSLAKVFKGRRFHDKTIYSVDYNGVVLDSSTAVSIKRSKNGFAD